MPKVNIPEEDKSEKSYQPNKAEKETLEFVKKRIDRMKEFRKQSILGANKSIEDIWREADREYMPHELQLSQRKRLESDDEEGLRSRLIKVGDAGDWQSNIASPDFYVKLNTAMSILVDENPEAVFLPDSKKYEANTLLAYENWKHSWEVSGAKQQLKNFIFNMAKYGIGFMKTYPKIIEIKKKIRIEYFPGEPDRDKFEERRLVKYNDLCRKSLNPWTVWWNEGTRVGDTLSLEDWYHEENYSYERFKLEFGDYINSSLVRPGMNTQSDKSDSESNNDIGEDMITVGFYENYVSDIYAIIIPSSNILLYYSPLPNDDGNLSLSFSPWTLRDDRCLPGIGIYEIIRNDSILYDRLLNMTMDQLVLSIYKMFFYKGTNVLGENGMLEIVPGEGRQVADPQAVKFLDIPGPGRESWSGLMFMQDRKDSISGVTPQLTATGSGSKTLGQDVQAKEAALERMKTPLDYILDALQNEAYVTLSWQKQILSTPEILEYTDPDQLILALNEMGVDEQTIAKYVFELNQPSKDQELFFNEEVPSEDGDGGQTRKFANVYREASLGIEKDESGELIESEKNKFYRFGVDLPTKRLDWKGIIRIKPQSVLAPSKELQRRQKLDMFNLVYPAIQTMLATPQFIPILMPPIKMIVKAYDQDVKHWMNEKELMALMESANQPTKEPSPEQPRLNFSVDVDNLPPQAQAEILKKYAGIEMSQPLFVSSKSAQNAKLMGGEARPVEAPQTEMTQQPMEQQEFEPIAPRDSVSRATQIGDLINLRD